jgi:hypothetical protein
MISKSTKIPISGRFMAIPDSTISSPTPKSGLLRRKSQNNFKLDKLVAQ